MAIEPIKGFYVHDEDTNTDGVARYDVNFLVEGFELTESPGYYNGSGVVQPASSSNLEVYTNKINVAHCDTVNWTFDTGRDTFQYPLWVAYMSYDANENVVGSRTQLSNETATQVSGTITVPDGVVYISFTYRTYGIDGFSAYAPFGTSALDKLENKIKKCERKVAPYAFPFLYDKFYGHLFTRYVSGSFSNDIIIPCQSIFDVQATARLGFKYIEANVHATATSGKYVVTHGISGKLGNDFETLDGQSASSVVIANTSFDDLRENYRYRSVYDKYRVPITSLEEFLYECRACNIYPLLQYVDETELSIARGIVGDNLILYAGDRSVFDGYIMEYANYTTEAQILARCSSVGSPYMYCMGNPTAFTDEQLKSIIAKVHSRGCYIGNAGNYDGLLQNVRLLNLGFDFSASGEMVNDFDFGNIINIYDNPTFDGLTTNGTISNGTLTLSQNQTITFASNDDSFLKKYILDITFEGAFIVKHPSTVDGTDNQYLTISSDGTQSMRLSGVLVDRELSIILWANEGGATVKSISFKMSRC